MDGGVLRTMVSVGWGEGLSPLRYLGVSVFVCVCVCVCVCVRVVCK